MFKDADAVIQQFYPGELGGAFQLIVRGNNILIKARLGVAIAEIIFGAVNPSGIFLSLSVHNSDVDSSLFPGKLSVSFPRSVGTTPVFYNYLKGSRPIDAGMILPNGTLKFGHQVRFANTSLLSH